MNQLQRNLLQDFFNLILSHYPNLPKNLLNDFVKSREPTVPSDAPSLTVKEKKPRKSNKKTETVITPEIANATDVPIVEASVNTETIVPVEKPVKEKKPRKSNKKTEAPIVEQNTEVINENINTNEAPTTTEPIVPVEKPVKEKKPRKNSKKSEANAVIENIIEDVLTNDKPVAPIIEPVVPVEKPVKEKKPRKSNKKTETPAVEQNTEVTNENINTTEADTVDMPVTTEPVVPVEKPIKEKKPRKSNKKTETIITPEIVNKTETPTAEVPVENIVKNELQEETIIEEVKPQPHVAEEETEIELEVRELTFENITYLLDDKNDVYNQETFEVIGKYDSEKNIIIFNT